MQDICRLFLQPPPQQLSAHHSQVCSQELFYPVKFWFCYRVLRQEYGAAVFVRLYRRFICTYLLRLVHYIHLVHSYERSHYRHGYRCISNYQRFRSLTCYLSQIFPCYQHTASVVFRDLLSYPHHKSSHQNRSFLPQGNSALSAPV